MIKGSGGIYDVLVDGEVAFTKAGACGPLPRPDEVVGALRRFLEPT